MALAVYVIRDAIGATAPFVRPAVVNDSTRRVKEREHDALKLP